MDEYILLSNILFEVLEKHFICFSLSVLNFLNYWNFLDSSSKIRLE